MANNTKNYFTEIEDNAAFSRVRVIVVTHPKKKGHARILVAYPKDGAGRLTVYIVDGFGDTFTTQKGTAGGYGYDKLTAALSGMTIDGHSLSDHCGADDKSRAYLKAWHKATAPEAKKKVEENARKRGYYFANWQTDKGWSSCYRASGLDYLTALGYQLIYAL